VSLLHTVYITTNLADGRFYIGKHTKRGQDNYKGSGKWVFDCQKAKIELRCDVVAVCQTEQDAYDFERVLVSASKKQYPKLCMNFNDGGKGNSSANELNVELRAKISKTLKGRKLDEAHRAKVAAASKKRLEENREFFAKTLEKARSMRKFGPESREKMRMAKLGKKQDPDHVRKRMEGMARAKNLRKQNDPCKN
jgi:hypothetical protein